MKIKKIMAVASAAALTLAVGMTSFAAPSVTGGITGGGTATTESGKVVEVVVKDPLKSDTLTEETKEVVSKLVAEDEATREEAKKAALEEAGVAVPEGQAANVLGVVDIDVSGLESGDTAYVTVDVPSAKMGDNIVVLHYNVETGKWENIPAKVTADGKVELTIKSASPFAFIVLAATGSEGGGTVVDNPTKGSGTDGKTTTTTTTAAKTAKASSTTSPKTGESTMVLMLGMVALVAAGSAFGLKKRA